MKAEEIMVGDWMKWKNRQVQIVGVSGIVYSFRQIDVVLAHCNDDHILEKHDIKSVSPIPLTSEILEKNGFVEQRLERMSVWSILGFSIELDFSTWKYYWANGDVEITSVHQLQHALKLCRIDKEIVI